MELSGYTCPTMQTQCTLETITRLETTLTLTLPSFSHYPKCILLFIFSLLSRNSWLLFMAVLCTTSGFIKTFFGDVVLLHVLYLYRSRSTKSRKKIFLWSKHVASGTIVASNTCHVDVQQLIPVNSFCQEIRGGFEKRVSSASSREVTRDGNLPGQNKTKTDVRRHTKDKSGLLFDLILI